jgi:UDP-N-acetylmuramoyl-L-alanyl-D-glutamate--2,6-diaminopimelate ligase
VAGLHYAVAAFTNLTEDHLDFHKTMEAYCDTKALLFQNCDIGVLNMDDQWFERICTDATCDIFSIAVDKEASMKAERIEYRADGIGFTAVTDTQRVPVRVGIPGKFTVYNALTVLGLAVRLGVSLRDAAEALATAQGVKGRIEVVPVPGKEYTVLIDYAHTPDGLQNVLSSVKQFCKGRLIAVFGCGGDRDPVKRPIMGRIGAELADIAIVTSDNPRSENPADIIDDILKGIPENRKNVTVIENRVKAIFYAMDIGRKDDIIVLAGKGHETYQEICGVKYHLDEREVVAERLAEMR